ncbi:hypothetical protein HPB47_003324 [Ixodes persulcatus]|uniref:Uncharacterized protein n=1 Tax=Ixodes persulcatus TaxID=34615 RepID=A0AC60PIT7_IXOPE|nr:hypothetical protein HPB47_003324 [Ixodes persulcatus]
MTQLDVTTTSRQLHDVDVIVDDDDLTRPQDFVVTTHRPGSVHWAVRSESSSKSHGVREQLLFDFTNARVSVLSFGFEPLLLGTVLDA